MQNNHIGLQPGPVKTYTPPKLPTLDETRDTPMPKILPDRWKKNAVVLACLSFAGVFSLASCADGLHSRLHHGGAGGLPFYVTQPTGGELGQYNLPYNGTGEYPIYITQLTEEEIIARIQEAELELRIHWGGSGSGPFYVAHITEQEVLAFIRARLEAAGLSLSYDPPTNTIWGEDDHGPRPGISGEISIDLYDALFQVAIISLSWEQSHLHFSPHTQEMAGIIEKEFAGRMPGMSFGVFYNPGKFLGQGDYSWEETNSPEFKPTHDGIEVARPDLIENLSAQIDAFIALLQNEGII